MSPPKYLRRLLLWQEPQNHRSKSKQLYCMRSLRTTGYFDLMRDFFNHRKAVRFPYILNSAHKGDISFSTQAKNYSAINRIYAFYYEWNTKLKAQKDEQSKERRETNVCMNPAAKLYSSWLLGVSPKRAQWGPISIHWSAISSFRTAEIHFTRCIGW